MTSRTVLSLCPTHSGHATYSCTTFHLWIMHTSAGSTGLVAAGPADTGPDYFPVTLLWGGRKLFTFSNSFLLLIDAANLCLMKPVAKSPEWSEVGRGCSRLRLGSFLRYQADPNLRRTPKLSSLMNPQPGGGHVLLVFFSFFFLFSSSSL